MRDGEGFWAVTLSEKALAGAGRLALLADEFRFEPFPPREQLESESPSSPLLSWLVLVGEQVRAAHALRRPADGAVGVRAGQELRHRVLRLPQRDGRGGQGRAPLA